MLNATIAKRVDVTKDLVIFRVKPDAGVPKFSPGQYVALGLMGSAPRPEHFPPETTPPEPAKIIKRAYSIGSSASDSDSLEFYIAILPQGALTARLSLLKEGDRLWMAPKITGTFTLDDVPPDHNLVFVSTGTGIAPFMSMLRTPGIWTQNRKIALVHGVRYPQDLAYRDELARIAESQKGFSYYSIVSRPDESWQGRKGYVHRLFEEKEITLDPKTDHVFACGNPAMIEELEKNLLAQGYTVHSKKHPGTLHIEKYW